MVDIDVSRQSLYENDHRALRAAYLARAAAAGVDVLYVLTERRCEGPWIDERAGRFLSAYFALPPELREALARLAGELAQASREAAP